MAKKRRQDEEPQVPDNSTSDSGQENIINVVWNFLSSMKLGIILLLIMALTSIIGTIWIPKDPATGQEDFVRFYNSIPFRLLLGLLALNLLVCSINRWKAIVSTFKGPKPDFSESLVKNMKSKATVKSNAGVSETMQQLRDVLKAKGYRVFVTADDDSGRIASDKGHFGIIGPYLTHISFMVMIFAIVIKFSGLVGFEGYLTGAVGQTYDLTSLADVQGDVDLADNFQVTINDFRTDYRPDGSVKQWYSDVTVSDQNNRFDYSISVNHPLIYKGIKFYQMSYGNQFTGKVSGPAVKDQPFTVGAQDYIQPANTDITFIPSAYDSQSNKVRVDIYKGNQSAGQQEVALNTPLKYDQAEVKFATADNFTVLSVKRDPGVPIVGVGSILLIVGVIISFLLRQRRLWAIVLPVENGSLVHIGGLSTKDKRGLDQDIEDIAEELED